MRQHRAALVALGVALALVGPSPYFSDPVGASTLRSNMSPPACAWRPRHAAGPSAGAGRAAPVCCRRGRASASPTAPARAWSAGANRKSAGSITARNGGPAKPIQEEAEVLPKLSRAKSRFGIGANGGLQRCRGKTEANGTGGEDVAFPDKSGLRKDG
jgi:hypothetical protein